MLAGAVSVEPLSPLALGELKRAFSNPDEKVVPIFYSRSKPSVQSEEKHYGNL